MRHCARRTRQALRRHSYVRTALQLGAHSVTEDRPEHFAQGIGSIRPIHHRKLRLSELITPTSSGRTARTTTFTSAQLLRCDAESRCE